MRTFLKNAAHGADFELSRVLPLPVAPNARPESSSSDGSAIYRPLLKRLDFIREPNNGSTVGV
jgi:hypothetical protein